MDEVHPDVLAVGSHICTDDRRCEMERTCSGGGIRLLCLGSSPFLVGMSLMDLLGFEPSAFRMRIGCDAYRPAVYRTPAK